MTEFGTLEGAKRKTHNTIAQANAEMEEYLQEANREIKKALKLFNNGVTSLATGDFKEQLNADAEKYAAELWHYNNNDSRPTEGLKMALDSIKRTIRAEFSKNYDGQTHGTFKKTDNAIKASTRGIGTKT